MRQLSDIRLDRSVFRSEELAGDALVRMQAEGAKAASVLEDDLICGFVTLESVTLADGETKLGDLQRAFGTSLSGTTTIRAAAKVMALTKEDVVAVMADEKVLGLLSATALLGELGNSWDPLTGLSWSDRLREWGTEQLESGHEISIVFMDIDDFGLYNKKFGHIVGDKVIKALAEHLGGITSVETDVLVRYAGDEFAIGTVRAREQAEEMVLHLSELAFRVEGVEEPVRFSYGLSGGKRTKEPSRHHVQATLDNLINLASQDCLERKAARKVQEAGKGVRKIVVASPAAEPVISDVRVHRESVMVALTSEGRLIEGVAQRSGPGLVAPVIAASRQALETLLPGSVITISEPLLHVGEGGRTMISVDGTVERDGQVTLVNATHPVQGDLGRTVAAAVIQAVLSAQPGAEDS
ncbi:MAG: GGDEF domain-containing protein [Fimbriimonadaceae bacterium]|jgi:diguanylate cyclase (GGDEF)-like protein|nr:GGDEF domain-containing protein [Fimbriimonadaceae bacterium]